MKKKLVKGRNPILFGVCSGLARYFELDIAVIRTIFLCIGFFSQIPIVLIYCILAFSMGPAES